MKKLFKKQKKCSHDEWKNFTNPIINETFNNEDEINYKNENKKSTIATITYGLFVILILVGVSYAVWNYSFIGSGNDIARDEIVVDFLESSNKTLGISNSIPISDTEGMAQEETYDFQVSTKTKNEMAIGYKLTLEKLEASPGYTNLDDSMVKVYLTDYDDNVVVPPTLVSDLDNYVLYEHLNSHDEENSLYKDKYKIRIWIDENVTGEDLGTEENLQYNFEINVDFIEKQTTNNVSDLSVSLLNAKYTYDGTEKIPEVLVKDRSKVLVEGTDYTVTYSNNINAGVASVVITGKGDYTGTVTKKFIIGKAESVCTISTIPSLEYAKNVTGNVVYNCTGDGKVSLVSSDENLIEIGEITNTNIKITALKNGTGTVTLKQAEGANYKKSNEVTKDISIGLSSYTVNVVVQNGTVDTASKSIKYGANTTFTISSSTGYGSPTVSCTNSQSASISGSTLTVSNVTKDTTCTVTYKANTYTITLNGNGATTSGTTSVTATYNSSSISPSTITLPKRAYTVSGFNANSTGATISSTNTLTSTYTFNGWYTGASGGSKVISNSTSPAYVASVSGYTDANSKWVKAGTATLYAQWTSSTVKLPTVTKTGYTCKWNTASNGSGTTYNSGATITPSANISALYAICTAHTYTVEYYSYDGKTKYGNSSHTYDAAKTLTAIGSLSNVTTPTGKTFYGWATSANSTTKAYSNGQSVSNLTSTSGGTVKLYAIWQAAAKTYTATTAKNVSSATGSNTTTQCTIPAVYNETTQDTSCQITLPANPYTLTNWTFNGWVNGGSSTTTTTQSGTAASQKMSISGNVNIVATWKKTVAVTVTFDKNGGSANTTSSAVNTTLYNGSTSLDTSLTFTAPSATKKTGYTFVGYNTSSTATTSSLAVGGTKSIAVKGTVAIGSTTYSGASGYYHIWSANTNTAYKVEHYVMNTSGSYPTSATSSENKTGTTDATLTLANLKLTTSSYNVTNGIIYSHGTVGGSTVTTTTVSADGTRVIKLYYKRTYGTLTTSAGSNVSSVTTQSAVKYYYGATVPTLTATLSSATGYTITFSKWTSSNTTYLANKTSNPTGTFTWPAMPEGTAITLTASATKTANEYTITLNGNGATTSGTTSVKATYNSSSISPSTITIPKRSYTVSGFNANSTGATISSTNTLTSTYTFNGWYTGASGGSKVISNSTSPAYVASVSGYTDANSKWVKEGAATLYAQWSSASVKLPTITKTGYTCKWNTASNGSGTTYNSGATITPSANISALYAICTAHTYTVEYYSYDGGTKYGNSSHTYGSAKSLTAIGSLSNVTTPTGKTFYGWATSANSTTKAYSDGQSVSNLTNANGGTVKLYAIWQAPAKTYTATTAKNVSSATGSNTTAQCTIPAVYNAATQDTSCQITLPANPYTLTNWTFNGWVNGGSSTTTTTKSGTAASQKMSISGNVNIVATWKKTSTSTFYYYDGSSQKTKDATCTMYNGGTSCSYSLPSEVSSSSGPSSTTYKGVSTSASSSTTTTSYTSANSKYYAVYTKAVTATFYYNSNTTSGSLTVSTATANGTRTSTTNGTTYSVNEGSITVPTAVTGSVGKYNSTYKGVSTSLSSMASSSATTANTTYYANYSKAVTIYYPTSTSAVSSGSFYRNEYFTSTSATSQVIGSSNTATSNITTISGILGTFKGLATSANTSSYSAVSTSAASSTATFYAVSTSSVEATFYYNSNATSGSLTVSTAKASGTRTNYCSSTSAATVAHGSITVPSAVTGSVGKYNSTYKGVSTSLSSMGSSSATTANTTYYANYSKAVTIYYPTSTSAVSSGSFYRNEYFTSTSATSQVIGSSNTATSNITTISGILGTFKGLATSANTSSYSSVSTSAASSTATFYAVSTSSVEATFYYNSNATSGSLTVSTAKASGTRTNYCSSTSAATVAHGSITIPTSVTGSVGQYNNAYVGIATGVNTMSSSTSATTGNTTYYAVYRSNVTIYRPTSASVASSITAYRNSYFTSTSAMSTVLSSTNTGTSTMSSVSGIYGTLKGFGSVNTSTVTYSSIDALLKSNTTTTYAISTSSVTISYNANGGSGAPSNQTTTRTTYCTSTSAATTTGNTTISSTKPTKTGYTFSKWNTKSDGSGTNYSSGTSYNIASSATLYAIYTINSYTVNVVVQNGTVDTATKNVEQNKSATFTISTSTGYNTPVVTCTNDQTGTISNNTLTVSNVTKDTTCTVTHKANTYQVRYNANGGVLQAGPTMTSTGTNPWEEIDGVYRSGNYHIASSTSTLTSEEFTLAETATISFEWAVSSESASYDYLYYTIYKDGSALSGTGTSTKIGGNNSVTDEANLTYTKVEKELTAGTYTIEFTYKKDSSADKGLDRGYVKNIKTGIVDPTKTMNNSTFTYDVEDNLQINKYIKEGYTFQGWSTSESAGIVNYQNGAIIKNLTSENNKIIDLYAVWKINSYDVNVVVQNGTVDTGAKKVEHGQNGVFNLTPGVAGAQSTVTCTNNQTGSITNNVLTVSNVTKDTTCTVKYVTEMTTLYTDGTLIINENLANRSSNITKHGAVTNEYDAMDETNSYVFSSSTSMPWNRKKTSVTSVEIGSNIKPISTAYWAYGLTKMTTGDFTKLDTSQATSMKSMFYNAGESATTWSIGDLSSWNTSSVTDMSFMFRNAGYKATTFNIGDLSGWNTSSVTNMRTMFYQAGYSATTWSIGDLSSWNTSSVTNMSYMFSGVGYSATTFNIGDLSSWNTSSVVNMYGMFSDAGYSATTWTIGNLSNWNTSSVTTMREMFSNAGRSATTWTIGNLSNWNTSSVTDMRSMFFSAGYSATTFNIGDLSNWNTSSVTTMYYMFNRAGYSATTFELDLSSWDTSGVTTMIFMFYNAGYSATTWSIGDLSGWNTSSVTSMQNMFDSAGYKATTFNIGNLSGWDTSSVTNMSGMFDSAGYSATTWTIGDLSSWNTSSVTYMSSMFSSAGYKATTFDIGDLSNWNTSSVTDMSIMFEDAGYSATTFELDLSSWNTSSVKDMGSMFREAGFNATTFNIGDLSNWNTSSVTTMSYMFSKAGYKATTFNIGDLSSWDTSQVTYMNSMFAYAGYSATTFELDLSSWDTSSVTGTGMVDMFSWAGYNATTFSIGDLSGWDTSSVTSMEGMFHYAGYKATWYLDCSGWNVNNVTSHLYFTTGVESKVTPPTWVN